MISEYAHLLEQRNFDEVLKIADKILSKNFSNSEAYFLKLLAIEKCSNAYELLAIGKKFSYLPFFQNAMKFTSNEERAYLQKIDYYNELVRNEILKKIQIIKSAEINTLDLKRQQTSIIDDVSKLVSELRETAGKKEQIYKKLMENVNAYNSHIEIHRDIFQEEKISFEKHLFYIQDLDKLEDSDFAIHFSEMKKFADACTKEYNQCSSPYLDKLKSEIGKLEHELVISGAKIKEITALISSCGERFETLEKSISDISEKYNELREKTEKSGYSAVSQFITRDEIIRTVCTVAGDNL